MEILESKYLYLGLMLFSISYPLAQSFEWRICFYKNWPFLFKATLIMMAVFIPWDIAFTFFNIWWFNDQYITGIKLFLLPIEEWLFFLIIPYACVFLYEVLNYYFSTNFLEKYAQQILHFLLSFTIVTALINYNKTYTFFTSLGCALTLAFIGYKKPSWLGKFFFAYLIIWIPFILINGALTGMYTSAATVNYNPEEIIGIRIFTIPIEDSIYNLFKLLLVVFFYEKFKTESLKTTVN